MPMYKKNNNGEVEKGDHYNNPLEWWKKYAKEYPTIAKIAMKYLAIPTTSASSERVWRRVSNVLT